VGEDSRTKWLPPDCILSGGNQIISASFKNDLFACIVHLCYHIYTCLVGSCAVKIAAVQYFFWCLGLQMWSGSEPKFRV